MFEEVEGLAEDFLDLDHRGLGGFELCLGLGGGDPESFLFAFELVDPDGVGVEGLKELVALRLDLGQAGALLADLAFVLGAHPGEGLGELVKIRPINPRNSGFDEYLDAGRSFRGQ